MTEVGFKVAGKPIMRSADDEKEDKFRKKLPMTTNIDLTKQINVPMNLIPSGSYEAEATAKNLIDWSKTLINNFETVSKILLHNEYIATLPNATPAELKNKKPDYPDVVTLYNKDFLNNVIKGGTLNQNKNEYPQNKTINFVLNVLSRSPKMLSEKSNENINNKNYNLSRKTSQEYLYDFLHTLHGGGTIATHINKNYEQFFDAAFLPGQYGIPSSIGFDEILGTDKKYETISTEHPLFSQTNLEIKYRPTNIAGQQTAGISSIKEAVSSKPERGIDYYHRKGRGNRFPVSNTKIDRPDIMTSYDFGNIKSLYQQSKDVVEKIISTEYLSGRKTKEQVLEQVKNTPKLTGAYYKSENYDKSNNKLPSKKDLFETTFTEKIASRVPALGVSEISMRNQDVNVSAQNPYFKAMMKYVNVSKEHYETNGFFDKKKLGKSVNSVTNLFGEFGNVVGTDGEKRVKFILKDKSLVDAKYHGIYDKLSTRFKELDEDLDSLSNDEVNAVSNIVGNKDKKH